MEKSNITVEMVSDFFSARLKLYDDFLETPTKELVKKLSFSCGCLKVIPMSVSEFAPVENSRGTSCPLNICNDNVNDFHWKKRRQYVQEYFRWKTIESFEYIKKYRDEYKRRLDEWKERKGQQTSSLINWRIKL